jgi:hypothetical protein
MMERVAKYKDETTNWTLEGLFADDLSYVAVLSTWSHVYPSDKKKKRKVVTTFFYDLVKHEWMEDEEQGFTIGKDEEPVWDKVTKTRIEDV